MSKKQIEKQIPEEQNFVISLRSKMRDHREKNLPRQPDKTSKNRIVLGILLIYIIGIVSGCSFDEMKQSEMNQVNLENSAEIDGQWIGVVDGIDGKPLELNYRFKAEGEKLIGLIESRLGGGPISGGKIDGNSIEFTLNAGETIILNSGTLSGDEIHITETIGEETIKVILKRVKR